ncbi:MAG: HNH endonuclease [Phycisphaerales bacterium]
MAKIACCYTCVFSFLDRELARQCIPAGIMIWPACANYPESYGRMTRTPPRGICPNYRPQPETPEGDVRQIALGDGYYAYVDAADHEWLGRYKWHMQGGYAVRYEKNKLIFMHRQIAQPPKGMIVDHKNRNKLDNTRLNLRVCTHQENTQNAGKILGTYSRFKGVSYRKERDKYFGQIYFNNEQFYLGLFDKETDAARAYDRRAIELFGEFARVNFPEEWPPQRRHEVREQWLALGENRPRGARIKPRKRKCKNVRRKEGKTSRRALPDRPGTSH